MTQTAESGIDPTAGPEPGAAAAPVRDAGGNAVGIASFVTGALALAPVALVLGIIGLARFRAGKASRRSWALAGTVLGAVGMVAGAAVAALYATSDAQAVAQDAHAQVDVVNVGNAVVDWYVANPNGGLVAIALTEDGYAVDGMEIAATIDRGEDHGFTLEAPDAGTWCLTLDYSGGASSSVGYSATDGLVDSCRVG